MSTRANEVTAGAPRVPSPAPSHWLEDVPTVERALSPQGRKKRYHYVESFAGYDADQIRTIAEVKRFFECFLGDRKFRHAVEAGGKFSGEQRQMLKDIGISFEPEAMAPLWLHRELVDNINVLVAQHDNFDDAPANVRATLAPYPEMRLWLEWRHRVDRGTSIFKLLASVKKTLSPEYTAWRGRRVAAVRNELGAFGWSLDHPCFAVEMAQGCSVGCGFCAFDAGRLETVFDLSQPRNRELVRDVASGMLNVLGWPVTHGMLYWSTEPHDNPHYVRLLRYWQEMTGAILCTATARSGEDWVRELIEYYSEGPVAWPRISVLSRKIMYRLHKAFTPLQMRDTTLLMQQKESEELRAKVPGGRDRMLKRLVGADDLRDVDFENIPDGFEPPQGSIACISGLLVNMVNRTVKLISPCYTTMRYRYGYRVFDETTFGPDNDFERAVQRMIGRSMVTRPYPEMPMRWRDDLKPVPQPDGFTLLSPTTRRDFRKGEIHLVTADLIGRGHLTYAEALDAMSENERIGPMAAMVMLDSLFDKGFLCEMAITRDYRARREAADPSLREQAVPTIQTVPLAALRH